MVDLVFPQSHRLPGGPGMLTDTCSSYRTFFVTVYHLVESKPNAELPSLPGTQLVSPPLSELPWAQGGARNPVSPSPQYLQVQVFELSPGPSMLFGFSLGSLGSSAPSLYSRYIDLFGAEVGPLGRTVSYHALQPVASAADISQRPFWWLWLAEFWPYLWCIFPVYVLACLQGFLCCYKIGRAHV